MIYLMTLLMVKIIQHQMIVLIKRKGCKSTGSPSKFEGLYRYLPGGIESRISVRMASFWAKI
jgi:hypothetical protein